MKKVLVIGVLYAMLLGPLTGCNGVKPVGGTVSETETETERESGQEEASAQETELDVEYRERNGDSWFTEAELRAAGLVVEQYYAGRGMQLISVFYEQEESPFAAAYSAYIPQYGERNVLVLEVQVKNVETHQAMVLVRQSPEAEWKMLEVKP